MFRVFRVVLLVALTPWKASLVSYGSFDFFIPCVPPGYASHCILTKKKGLSGLPGLCVWGFHFLRKTVKVISARDHWGIGQLLRPNKGPYRRLQSCILISQNLNSKICSPQLPVARSYYVYKISTDS